MTLETDQPQSAGSKDPRVLAAVDQIIDALELKPAHRSRLIEFIGELDEAFPKLDHVSFYAATTRTGGINYRITYNIPGYPRRTERLGRVGRVAYKRAVRVNEVLEQVHARLMRPEEAHRLLYVDAQPIGVHIDKFEANLRSGNVVERYVKTTITRLRRCCELGRFDRITDIRRESLPGLITELSAFIDPDTKRKLSESTVNDYLAVLRQFTRWATPALLPVDPLVNSKGIRVTKKDRRRDILVEEIAAIVAQARVSTRRFNVGGDDRAMLYLTAYGTGLRANELRSLDVKWLKLDVDEPHITLPATAQKKTGVAKDVRQPLPAWLAAELKAWLGDRKQGRVFIDMPRDVVVMLDADREDARVAWIAAAEDDKTRAEREKSDFLKRQTHDGKVVFHSHRHTYATQAVSHLDLKTAQTLTRHATTAMLMDVYAHSRLKKASQGVNESVPNPIRTDS